MIVNTDEDNGTKSQKQEEYGDVNEEDAVVKTKSAIEEVLYAHIYVHI